MSGFCAKTETCQMYFLMDDFVVCLSVSFQLQTGLREGSLLFPLSLFYNNKS